MYYKSIPRSTITSRYLCHYSQMRCLKKCTRFRTLENIDFIMNMDNWKRGDVKINIMCNISYELNCYFINYQIVDNPLKKEASE